MNRRSCILAVLLVSLPTGGAGAAQLCFAPPTTGGPMVIELCTPPGPNWDSGWQGFGTSAAEACHVGAECGPVEGPTVWYLSNSVESPHHSVEPLPPGRSMLYLWLYCTRDFVAGAEFSLTGDIDVLSYTPMNGTGNTGSLPDFHVTASGCPLGPIVFGALEVQPAGATAAGETTYESWGRVKARYAASAPVGSPQ